MLRSLLSRRALAIVLGSVGSLLIAGYAIFVFPNRTLVELGNLRHENLERGLALARLRNAEGESAEFSRARAEFIAWQAQTRKRCMQIAAANPEHRDGAIAMLMVANKWPESAEAKEAHTALVHFAKTAPLNSVSHALNESGGGSRDLDVWRPFATQLIDRAHREPNHAKSAEILCKAAGILAPADNSTDGPCEEFIGIADLISTKFAAREDIQNFCEIVGGNGNAPEWGRAYEPHLRKILEVNKDRFVRCAAKFNLASVVKADGDERQEEARKVFEEFLNEFDGQTQYSADGVEVAWRQQAQRILRQMETLGLGMKAPETTGVDLDGQPMSMSEYRGKVVLVSFWATWCGPCMRAIPHEKKLVEHFDPEKFAIVGVNGDTNPDHAATAVQKYDITWRSFQSERGDGSRISSEWQVSGWPTFYLIDADGLIAKTWEGEPAESTMIDAIGAVIERANK